MPVKGRGKKTVAFQLWRKKRRLFQDGKSKETGLTQERGIRGSVML